MIERFRGSTTVNGIGQGNPQRNFTFGSEMNVSINSRNSLLVEFAQGSCAPERPRTRRFAVKYDYTWGGGYK